MSQTVILALTLILAAAFAVAGAALWWPTRRSRAARSELGSAFLAGAIVAFAVLLLQNQIEDVSQRRQRADAQAAARQSLRLQLSQDDDFTGIDLRGRWMRSFFLRGKTLDLALLSRSDLTGANLSHARVTGAFMNGTILNGARLDSANLSGSVLNKAELVGANLQSTVMTGAQLCGADLRDARMDDATSFEGATVNAKTLPPRKRFDWEGKGAHVGECAGS